MNPRTAFALFILSVLAMLACSQSGGVSPDLGKANELFAAGRYAEALPIFRRLTEGEQSGAGIWMRLAYCQLETKDPKGAIVSYEQAMKKGGAVGMARYNMACAYARLGETARALDEIEKAIAANFGRRATYEGDPDFGSLKSEPRFKEMMERLSSPAKGYKGSDAMDLWVGEWDVFVNGQPAGKNQITKTLDGFGIEERWTSANGSKGQSLFTFDAKEGTWRQLWIDDRGWVVDGIGVPIENGIRFEGESIYPNGQRSKIRTTLSKNADGTVRQLIETMGADGKWTVGFDGRYVRKSAK